MLQFTSHSPTIFGLAFDASTFFIEAVAKLGLLGNYPPKARKPAQQTCKVCGRPDKFDFHVPDEIWASIIPPELQAKVVCLYCFDEFAHKRRVDYSQGIKTLYFTGEQAIFEFNVVWGKGATC